MTYMFWVGLALVVCAAMTGFVAASEIPPVGEQTIHRVILSISAAAVLAIGGVLMGSAAVKQKDDATEVVKSRNWTKHEIVTDSYFAHERIEIVRTGAGLGVGFVQRLRLKRIGTNQVAAEVAIIRLFESAFWRSGHADQLYARPGKRVDLNAELESERIRELLASVQYVLCLGLASSTEAPNDRGGGLSHRRANRLQEWLNFSPAMLDRDAKVIAVPLGQARTSRVKESKEERDQRSAVLVGVRIENEFISLPQALDEIRLRIRSEVVALDDYPGSLRPENL